MAIAKGLGGGFAPIGAVLVRDKIFEAFAKGSGLFQHGHTYLGHPLACAGALAVQQVIRRDNLLANVRRQGEHLTRRLGERFGNHHHVGDVRGRGLFQAIELVADRGSKATFDPKHKLHARIKQQAMARGLMVYPMGGTIDGVNGDHVLLAPPFIVDEAADRHHRRAAGRRGGCGDCISAVSIVARAGLEIRERVDEQVQVCRGRAGRAGGAGDRDGRAGAGAEVHHHRHRRRHRGLLRGGRGGVPAAQQGSQDSTASAARWN